jgi:hypothetical protein
VTDWTIVNAMVCYGGSFARTYAVCWQHADPSNQRRLREAFPELWAEYAALARMKEPDDQAEKEADADAAHRD